MATKLYLTAQAAPYAPATIRGTWNLTASVVTKALLASKRRDDTIVKVAVAETSATNPYNVLLYRGVSGPLDAQTVSGTIDVLIPVVESSGLSNNYWHLHVYVTQGDSDTPRGTLLSDYIENTTNEWYANSNTDNAQGWALQSAQSLSSLAVSSGDRLVIELGYAARNTSTTSYVGAIHYGTTFGIGTAPDATAAGAASLNRAGFVTFSADLAWVAATTRATQEVTEHAYVLQGGTARASQVVVEYAAPASVTATARVSQVLAEYLNGQPAATRLSQVVVEFIRRPPLYDCPDSSPGPSLCGQDTIITWVEHYQHVRTSP